MPRVGVVVGGVIAVIGAILGIIYGWSLFTQKDLITLFYSKMFYASIVIVVSIVTFICGLLLLMDKLAVLNALIVFLWGVLLLGVFGGPFLALIAAVFELMGGIIGIITSAAI
jgi:hypothetical protein